MFASEIASTHGDLQQVGGERGPLEARSRSGRVDAPTRPGAGPSAAPATSSWARLIDNTLFEAGSVGVDLPTPITSRSFDPVVGNPPWTFVKKEGGAERRRASDTSTPLPRRSPD